MHHGVLDGSLLAYFENLYRLHRLRGSPEPVLRQHRISLAHFSRILGHVATTDDLTDSNVSDAMWWLVDHQRSERYANKLRDNICALWRFLAQKGVVSKWPDVQPVPEPERIPVAWSRDDLQKLWTACATQRGQIGGVPASLWWSALHAIMWDSGERIGATIKTEWRSVDLTGGWITARAEHRKGSRRKRKDKLSRLHPDTVRVLASIREPVRKLVLPWDRSYYQLWYYYGKLLKEAGLPNDRDHKFHCIRKSAASWFEAAGGDATTLLGHSDRRTTVQHYLDPRIAVREQHAADVLFRPGESG